MYLIKKLIKNDGILSKNFFASTMYFLMFSTRKRGKKERDLFNQFRRKNDSQEIAKSFFDANYVKIFKNDWPAVRCAMLCRKKYCAIINNFVTTKKYEDDLINSGAYDLMEKLRKHASRKVNEIEALIASTSNPNVPDKVDDSIDIENMDFNFEEAHASKLVAYKKLKSSCIGLKMFIYPKSNLTEFEETIENNLQLSFFLDGSSILPILALDPRPSDSILDMCSAPGGKLNIMMQTLGYIGSGNIVANDVSLTKINQVKKHIKNLFPDSIDVSHFVQTITCDGIEWNPFGSGCYSKVLVDAPSTADRTSLFTPVNDGNNIFSTLRKRERAQLPELQSALLRNAILACQPGGIVVYCTSTASHHQNQFVIQYTVQELLQDYNISCEVQDLNPLITLLEDEFHFQKDISVGILVKPRLDANYGPTYVCKLRRLN